LVALGIISWSLKDSNPSEKSSTLYLKGEFVDNVFECEINKVSSKIIIYRLLYMPPKKKARIVKTGGELTPQQKESLVSDYFTKQINDTRKTIKRYINPNAQTSEVFRVYAQASTNLALAVMNQ
jgi:hypothetical protein